MKKQIVLMVLLLAIVGCSAALTGCGTEAKKKVTIDNGQGVVINYDTVDGGSQGAATGKDVTFKLDAAGNIDFNYSTESESQEVVTNDPAEVVEAAGDAAASALTGGLNKLVPDN